MALRWRRWKRPSLMQVMSPKQFRQQAASAAAGAKELAAIHAEYESQKAKADYLNEAPKVSQKEATIVEGVVKEQRAFSDATGARMAILKDRRMRQVCRMQSVVGNRFRC